MMVTSAVNTAAAAAAVAAMQICVWKRNRTSFQLIINTCFHANHDRTALVLLTIYLLTGQLVHEVKGKPWSILTETDLIKVSRWSIWKLYKTNITDTAYIRNLCYNCHCAVKLVLIKEDTTQGSNDSTQLAIESRPVSTHSQNKIKCEIFSVQSKTDLKSV